MLTQLRSTVCDIDLSGEPEHLREIQRQHKGLTATDRFGHVQASQQFDLGQSPIFRASGPSSEFCNFQKKPTNAETNFMFSIPFARQTTQDDPIQIDKKRKRNEIPKKLISEWDQFRFV